MLPEIDRTNLAYDLSLYENTARRQQEEREKDREQEMEQEEDGKEEES